MARDTATHDCEAVFRNTWATGIYPDNALVQEAFEGPTTVKADLILNLTGPLAGWKLLDMGSSLGESSVDFALQGADDTALDVYIYLLKSNNLHGTRRRNSQPPTHPADTASTVKSSWVRTDGDSL